jgi:phosphate uptake regulator
MEQRKLIQHGLSSMTVALPIKWLKERGLKKGDPVYIEVEGGKLVVSTKEPLKMERVSVDVSRLDRTSMLLYVQSLYRFGYNEIEVKFDRPATIHYRLDKKVSISSVMHYIVNRLVGAEIVEQEKDRILIRYITRETGEGEDFKMVLRRVFILMRETAENLLSGAEKGDMNAVAETEDRHDNVTKFVSYALRLLNKYGHPDVKKTCFYYHIIASIDKIMDILKYNARDLLKYKKALGGDTVAVWRRINDSIRMYEKFFYDFSMENIEELSKNRDHTKNLLRDKMEGVPSEELLYLTSMRQVLEIILDLTDFRMGLES